MIDRSKSAGCTARRALGLTGALLFLLLAAAPLAAEPRKMIENIRVETGVEGKVGVFFKLSGSFPPRCFSLVGENRRLVCDFIDTSLAPDIARTMEVESELLFRIRTGRHTDPVPKTRVVLDMDRRGSYDVQQLFVQGKNEYVLVIQPLGGGVKP